MKKRTSVIVFLMTALLNTTFAQNNRVPSKGLAMFSKEPHFAYYNFTRHAVGDNDLLIENLYAGICHSDIHTGKSEWAPISYPFVGGHEIAGRVVRVGKNVTKFKVGDYAGIGCLINACGQCYYCKKGEEQFCEKGLISTYASTDYFHNNETTQGGYSNNYVIAENFAIKIPANADMKKVAPLLCAGITTYSPIHFSKVKKGDTVAVAGFGGLGHMAVKYLTALSATVTVFDITEEKRADAKKMGAAQYINVNNVNELKNLKDKFTFIISTIPAKYDPMMYVKMLKEAGEMAIVGVPASENTPIIPTTALVFNARRKVYGSLIGGIKETQEMLDFSVANNIYPDVEVISATPESIDKAYQNVLDGKVKFRYVIDMQTMQ